MNNIKSYEAIAREAGCAVLQLGIEGCWVWINADNFVSDLTYPTRDDAWVACVHENGLVEE